MQFTVVAAAALALFAGAATANRHNTITVTHLTIPTYVPGSFPNIGIPQVGNANENGA